jgi:hypothetical protein
MLGRAIAPTDVPILARTEAGGIDGGLVLPDFASQSGTLTLTLPDGDENVAGVSLRRAIEAGVGTLSLGVSVGMHEGSAMGLRIPVGEGAMRGRTAGLSLGYRVGIGSGGKLEIEAEFGRAAARSAGMIARVDGIRYDGLSLRYSRGDIAARGDRLSLVATQPVALTGGRAQMDLPTGMAGDRPVFSRLDIGLAPAARQFDLGVEYARPIARQASLRLGVMQSENHGHRRGARDMSVIAGLSARF